ncbi:hypothetical protein GGR08_000307 [Bartonella fuyuanensis]|uniref:Uncharacterized protein n=1 Tax=Bartonella fuyuanensis TaxID=1460968 RepID=A0A840E4E0_9HYPH|nr:hypothetical protein [Bartonella fuyuanensis]MBB4076026.1 hypothetical protein [Bartonella fuyuanensis]
MEFYSKVNAEGSIVLGAVAIKQKGFCCFEPEAVASCNLSSAFSAHAQATAMGGSCCFKR